MTHEERKILIMKPEEKKGKKKKKTKAIQRVTTTNKKQVKGGCTKTMEGSWFFVLFSYLFFPENKNVHININYKIHCTTRTRQTLSLQSSSKCM